MAVEGLRSGCRDESRNGGDQSTSTSTLFSVVSSEGRNSCIMSQPCMLMKGTVVLWASRRSIMSQKYAYSLRKRPPGSSTFANRCYFATDTISTISFICFYFYLTESSHRGLTG